MEDLPRAHLNPYRVSWTRRSMALLLSLFGALPASADQDAGRDDDSFDQWVRLATTTPRSDVTADAGDRVANWQAPNNQSVHIVIKSPHPRSGAAIVTMNPVSAGVDARPSFEDALARVRAENAAKLIIPAGEYTFASTSPDALGHLVIRGLHDVVIDGGGSTLVFSQNAVGLYLTSNQRIKLTNLKLTYSLHMASLGQIKSTPQGNELAIDPRYPVTESDAVTYLSEYDPWTRNWVRLPQRVIVPPGSKDPIIYAGNQTYQSPSLRLASPGKTFVVFHHWYGGNVIEISDLAGQAQSEDLTFDGITILSGPGMGIVAYGMRRGLAIVNSRIAPDTDSSSVVSTEFDAIHVLLSGGDVIISDNVISGQGDDAINFSGLAQPVLAVDSQGTKMTLGAYSRFIQSGDALALFDSNSSFIGQVNVVQIRALGGLNNEITLAAPIARIAEATVVRDLRLINSRYLIQRNKILNCHCHAILAEAPYGLIDDNTISGTAYNPIRLLTSVGPFKEGFGAFDVIVSKNNIAGTGADNSIRMPWGAISAYGVARGNTPSSSLVNSSLEIVNNRINEPSQGCITIMSSQNVTVSDNTCDRRQPPSASPTAAISVRNSTGVVIARNRLGGNFSQPVDIDASTTRNVTVDGSAAP
jgi:hypothetical protein